MDFDPVDEAFEQKLRSGLGAAAAEADPAPLGADRMRRIRFRQGIGVAVAAVFIAGAAFAVSVVRPELDASREFSPAAGPKEFAPSGSGGRYPCQQPQLEGECVARGEYAGVKWAIGAYVDDDKTLCIEEWEEGGGGHACGSYDPEEIGLGISVSSATPNGIANGDVGPHVDRLILEDDKGDWIELELYPAPDGFELDARFYNVFLPSDAEALVAFDEAGNEVAREEIDMEPLMEEDGPISGVHVAQQGEIQGEPWTLKVHEELINGEPTVCSDFTLGRHEKFGGGGSCDIGVPDEHAIGFSETTFERKPSVIAVFGVVTGEADSVWLEPTDGDRVQGYLVDAPVGIRQDVQLFTILLDEIPEGTIVAGGRDGKVLERRDLCDPDFVRENFGGTCGP